MKYRRSSGLFSRAEGCWTFDARDRMPRPSRPTAHHLADNAPTVMLLSPARAGSFFDPDRVKTRTPGRQFKNFSRFSAFSAITGSAKRKNSLQMRRFQTISEFSHGLGRLRRFGADAANVGSRHVCDGALPRAEASAWVPKPNFGEQAITRPQPGTGQLSHLRRTSELGHSWSVEPRCVVDEIASLL